MLRPEIDRIVQIMSRMSPFEPGYEILVSHVSCLINAQQVLSYLPLPATDVVEVPQPQPEVEEPQPEVEETKKAASATRTKKAKAEKTPTLEEFRAHFTAARDKGVDVKQILQATGVTKISDIPEGLRNDVIAQLEEAANA